MSTSPSKLTAEELRARRAAEKKETERLRAEEAVFRAKEDAPRDREFEVELARVEAEKLEEERIRAAEEKRQKEKDAKEREQARLMVLARLGKRKAVDLDEDDDEGSVSAEGSVSTRYVFV